MSLFYKPLLIKGLSFFLFLILTATSPVEAGPLKVSTSAKAGVLMNAKTGEVLWEKNAHLPLTPASTTKLVTALVAVEKGGHRLYEEFTASSEALRTVTCYERLNHGHPSYRLEFGGTHMWMLGGERMSFYSLLEGLMLPSANDAANVIAEHISGSVPLFMEEVNRFVKEQGCMNTFFNNPHGLPHPEHKTTAYDLALLTRCFLSHEVLKTIVCQTSAKRPQTNKQKESVLPQGNPLVKPGRFYYSKAKGVKTGYSQEAGFCVATAAEDENRDLVLVLLGCPSREARSRDAIALFEAAFNEPKIERRLLTQGFDTWTHPCIGGKEPITAKLSSDVTLAYYPSEEPKLHTRLSWKKVEAPVEPGAIVGGIEVVDTAGHVLASGSLEAVREVKATWHHQLASHLSLIKPHRAWVMASLGFAAITGAAYLGFRRRR